MSGDRRIHQSLSSCGSTLPRQRPSRPGFARARGACTGDAMETSSNSAGRITIGLALWGGALTAFVAVVQSDGYRALLIALAVALFLAGLATLLWSPLRAYLILLGRRLETGSRLHQSGSEVRIADLLSPDGVLRSVDIRDCFLVGPAILVHDADTPFVHCTFDEYDLPPIWVIPGWIVPGKETLGAVKVENCTFTRCRFQRVAWAMESEQLVGLMQTVEEFNKATEDAADPKASARAPPS